MIKSLHIPEENWRSSTFSQSNGGECVQIADAIPGAVPVRDSKNPHGSALVFKSRTFSRFVQAVQRGEFDLS